VCILLPWLCLPPRDIDLYLSFEEGHSTLTWLPEGIFVHFWEDGTSDIWKVDVNLGENPVHHVMSTSDFKEHFIPPEKD
jgi:hypothetical protein